MPSSKSGVDWIVRKLEDFENFARAMVEKRPIGLGRALAQAYWQGIEDCLREVRRIQRWLKEGGDDE